MNDAPIVPNFDDDEEGTGRKLVIIASKGNLDMAYPPLILAAAALGEGIETHIFFTFWGFDIINKATMKDLQFTLLGIVGAKLLLFDATGRGTLTWAATLIGVALLVLAAGYFAPLPPEGRGTLQGEDE